MSPHDLDEISHEDAVTMWELYQKGMAGPSVHYINGYHIYGMLHKISETLVAVNSKNYKPNPPEKFEELYKQQYNILALQPTVARERLSSGTQAMLALVDANAPEWLCKAAQEEIHGSTNTINSN